VLAKIQKWGNSQAVRLPKAILELADMRDNDSVDISAEKDTITIKRESKRVHKTLAERIADFNEDYSAEEWKTGKAVGKEVM